MAATVTTHSSSSSSISFLSHPKIQSHQTLQPHQWFSLINFSKTSRIELRPILAPTSFQSIKHLLIQCSCLSLLTNLHTESEMVVIFKEIGFNEAEMESLLEKNPILRVKSLDKIRARILSLQSIGITDIALYRVIMKSPNVLISEEVDTLIRFLRDDLGGMVEPTQLERLFTATDTRFLAGFDQKVRLLLQHGVPEEKIVHVLNNFNLTKGLCLKSVEEIERTIAFLKPFGGTDMIVRRPKILNYDLETQLIPRIEILKELSGGDMEATGAVFRRLPAILSYSVKHVKNHIEFFRSFVGLSDEEIFKIFLVFPGVVSASRERKLQPRIAFLKQCGLNSNEIFKFLSKAPLYLALSFEDNLAFKLGFLVKIGYEYNTRELAVAMGAVSRTSCENMQKVIGVFLSYGLSFADILAMSKKHPQILQYNHSSLEEKVEYLIVGMGRGIEELLAFPAFLGYKLDDRIKQRYEEKKSILGEGMSINKLLSVSSERFSTKRKKKHIHN